MDAFALTLELPFTVILVKGELEGMLSSSIVADRKSYSKWKAG